MQQHSGSILLTPAAATTAVDRSAATTTTTVDRSAAAAAAAKKQSVDADCSSSKTTSIGRSTINPDQRPMCHNFHVVPNSKSPPIAETTVVVVVRSV